MSHEFLNARLFILCRDGSIKREGAGPCLARAHLQCVQQQELLKRAHPDFGDGVVGQVPDSWISRTAKQDSTLCTCQGADTHKCSKVVKEANVAG